MPGLHKTTTSVHYRGGINQIRHVGASACPTGSECGREACRCAFGVCVIKVDARTGTRLTGTLFSVVDPNGATQTAVTGENGVVVFRLVPCVFYMLSEIKPSEGYWPLLHPAHILVDRYGRLRVNGRFVCRRHITVANCPMRRAFCFSVLKVDAVTGAVLPGAVFELLQHGQSIARAVSGSNGKLIFGRLRPGAYQLVEVSAPPGYQVNPDVYAVLVSRTGKVSINGLPTEGFSIPDTPVFPIVFRKVAMDRDEASDL